MRALVESMDVSLDLLGIRPRSFATALEEMKTVALCRADMTEEDVRLAIERRATLRQEKAYDAADGVRLEMEARGVYLMDLPTGTTWRPGVPQEYL